MCRITTCKEVGGRVGSLRNHVRNSAVWWHNNMTLHCLWGLVMKGLRMHDSNEKFP